MVSDTRRVSTASKKSLDRNNSDDDSDNERKTTCCNFPLPPYFDKKCIAILAALCHATRRQRIAILKSADNSIIRCICECALNVLRGVVSFPSSKVKKLTKYKNVIRKLVQEKREQEAVGKIRKKKKKINWGLKKKFIVQNGGGFLPYLLTPILEVLINRLIK